MNGTDKDRTEAEDIKWEAILMRDELIIIWYME